MALMRRLLVVEDDLRIARLLTRFLTGENFAVDVVSDGREAVDSIRGNRHSLVLLDMRLPGLDGIDVCQAVRPDFKEPILMLTARGSEQDVLAGFSAGADDYVTKPFSVAELAARVAAQPNDHQARFDLAMALHAAGEREAAVEALIEIIGRDRNWNEEAARHQLLKFFEAWGPKDELTQSARRRLSSLLFS